MNNRDIRIDWMRGVGILLMIIGHTVEGGFVHSIIYSFHMPLFFILSGYFAKVPIAHGGGEGKTLIINLLKRLMLPFTSTVIAIIIIQYFSVQTIGHVMGPLWFLLALFWARLAYWLIQSLGKWTLIMSLLIGFAAYLSSILWMENRVFCIHGLCALPFVAIGGKLQKYTASEEWHKKYQNWVITVLFVCIVCWVLAVFVSHLEMRACSFGCWPLDIAGACGGTFILWLLAKCFMENQKICNFAISKAIIWCGRYSMAILCMHSLEWKALLRLEQMLCSGGILLLLRFTITIVLAAIVVYTPIFNKIYR